jgi:hypothetical protein
MDSTVNKAELKAKATIARVARRIAQGPPPEWLLGGLTYFSGMIGEHIDAEQAKELRA